MSGARVRRFAYASGLAVAWVMLWDRISLANFLAGLGIAAVVLVAFPLRPVAPTDRRVVRLGPLARLVGATIADVASSTWLVAKQIVTGRRRLNTGLVACRMRSASPKALSTISNILALSPDTMAVQATNDPPTLYVHVLVLDDIIEVRRKIAHLERLVIEALGSDAERSALRIEHEGSQP